MGTRGVLGFRKNGVDKLMYNHFDSYPDGLGKNVVDFIKATRINEMSAIFDRIEMIDEDTLPTAQQIEDCKKWTDTSVSTQSTNDWYCLLRKAQFGLNAYYKEGLKFMLEANDFIKDSMVCEFGYIINLDDNVLEFYVGNQDKPQRGNRYGQESINGYYPCKLIKSYKLVDNPVDWVGDMNKLSNIEDEDESTKNRWDFVDNSIHDLIVKLNPSKTELKYNGTVVGEIRDVLINYFVNELKICTEDEFYK